jgi:hypothetical protein
VEAQGILERIKRIIGEADLVWVDDQPGDSYLVVPKEKLRPYTSREILISPLTPSCV